VFVCVLQADPRTILRNSLRISLKKARTGEESRFGEALSFFTSSSRFDTGGSHSVTGSSTHRAHSKQAAPA